MESFDLRNLGEGLEGKGTLAAALAIAAGTQAYAVPIRYDNPAGPDHYQWDSFIGNNLDIRFGPTGQADVGLDGITVNADYQYGSGYYVPYYYSKAVGIGYYAGFAQSSLFGGASFLRNGYYLLPIAAGADVGVAGQTFDFNNYVYADLSFYYYNTGYAGYSGLQSFLNIGLNYLGLRLTIDTVRGLETHYGWLAVDVQEFDLFEYYSFGDLSMLAVTNAVAWGWETEPGVPIAAGAPTPGTLGALAFGAVAACGRGRRKKSA
jgi:hypothetical protein